MRGLARVDLRSARAARVAARLPRLALLGLCGVLSLLGVRALAFGTGGAESALTGAPLSSGSVQGFAEGFARAYLSWSSADATARERALAPYLGRGLDPGAGLEPAPGTEQTVTWTAALGDEQGAGGVRVVRVAAAVGPRVVHLGVPVAEGPDGFAVVDYPALIGPPIADAGAARPPRTPADDAELSGVVRRAIVNYLAGDAANLTADLARGALVSLPARLPGARVESVDWTDRAGGCLSVQVLAPTGAGGRVRLAYPVGVRRAERWFVAAIGPRPAGPAAPKSLDPSSDKEAPC